MPTLLILAAITFAGLGLAVPSTICFLGAVFLWERRRV